MKNKKLNRNAKKRILSVVPITSREEIGTTVRNRTLCSALMRRYKTLERYAQESAQLRAAIKALGGKLDE